MTDCNNFIANTGAPDATVIPGRSLGETLLVKSNAAGGQDVYLELARRNFFTEVNADVLRDAIDKAVGKRKEEVDWRDSDRVEVDWTEGRIIVGRETVGKHAGQWVFPSGFPYGDDAVANLNPKAVPASTAKPYRPVDRDRLLRHIEDVEASLTRRNERWERDQERIRELEAEVFTLREIKDSYEEPKTAREYLDLAWEAAHVPADDMIHAGEEFLCKDENGIRQPAFGTAPRPFPADLMDMERRLLDPRVEPTEEELVAKELYADIENDLELDELDDDISHMADLLVRLGWRKVAGK